MVAGAEDLLGEARLLASRAGRGRGPAGPGRRLLGGGGGGEPGGLQHLVRRLPVHGLRCTSRPAATPATSAAITARARPAAISDWGARSRVQATGVGAPFSFSTVTIASPVPSWVSTSSRS